MNTSASPLSIVICAFNGLEYTKLLLESIRKNSKFSHEVILYSDGSTDGTAEWLRSRKDLWWQHDRTNRGICTAMNRAARMATREYLFFPNTDHFLAPGWDEAMLRHLAPRTVVSCQCVEPGIVPVASIFHARDCGGRWDEFDEAKFLAAAEELRKVRTVPGVNYPFALSKSLWDQAGGLDEQFNPGPANDPDLFYRLHLLGAEMVRVDDCLAYHFSGKSSRLAGEVRVEHKSWHEVTERNEARFADKWGERYRYSNGGLPDPGPEAEHRWNSLKKSASAAIKLKSRLKVAIDGDSIDDGAQGIGVYTLNLVRALAARRDEVDVHLLSRKPGKLRTQLADVEGISIYGREKSPKDLGAQAYHGPAFALPEGIGIPAVVTVHDIIFALFPEWYPEDFVRHMNQTVRRSLDHAVQVIAVSDQTKSDLVARFNVGPEHITRIHEAPPPDSWAACAQKRHLDVKARYAGGHPYVLAVGMQQRRKNAAGLVRAFSQLKGSVDGSKLRLLLVGGAETEDPELPDLIKRLRLSRIVVRTHHVPRVDLLALYQAAEVFVYPSFYEGFGLPPLEAMACGTPVVASNRSSLPEILRDAAIMTSPDEPMEIAKAIRSVLEDPKLRSSLVERGKSRAARFTWPETARQTLDVYRKALAAKPIEVRIASPTPRPRKRSARSSRPRIAVDARFIGMDRLGTGRYTSELLPRLVDRAGDVEFVFIGPSEIDAARFRSSDSILQLVPAGPETLMNPAWEQYSLPSHLLGCDLYFAPTGIAPVTAQCPTVPVIHDLGFEDHPEYYEEVLRKHLFRWVRNSCLAADRIIAVSEFTRDGIARRYGVPTDRIEVVHHGSPRAPAAGIPDRESPYILCVSSFEPNKNLPMLVEAFRIVAKNWRGRLVLAGRSGRDLANVQRAVGANGFSERAQVLVDPGESELCRLYGGASLFAFPSKYEGFGLPILEAMTAGLPVIVGSAAAAGEVAGEAARSVAEETPEAWAAALNVLLKDPKAMKEMAERSLARAARFTWESSAEKTWNLLMTCLESA